MSVVIRSMLEGEENAVVDMVQALTTIVEPGYRIKMTPENLRADSDIALVMIAENNGHLVGAGIYNMTYSSWRGTRGIYVCDLFVLPETRNQNIGLKLLHAIARDGKARGGGFIKLEVQEDNIGAAKFYDRIGFRHKENDGTYILEPSRFTNFTTGEIA